MTRRFWKALFAFFVLLSTAGIALAQPAPEPGKTDKDAKKTEKDGGTDTPKGEGKDPTVPSPKLKELLYPEKSGKGSGTGPGPKMPSLGLRGRVIVKDQPAIALLEVDGKIFVISKGSSLPGGGNTMLRVIEITSREVRIEVLPFKEIVILR
jgi:hypothetical protein